MDADIGMLYDSYLEWIAVTSQHDFRFPCDDCVLMFRRGKHAHVIPMKFANKTNGVYVGKLMQNNR